MLGTLRRARRANTMTMRRNVCGLTQGMPMRRSGTRPSPCGSVWDTRPESWIRKQKRSEPPLAQGALATGTRGSASPPVLPLIQRRLPVERRPTVAPSQMLTPNKVVLPPPEKAKRRASKGAESAGGVAGESPAASTGALLPQGLASAGPLVVRGEQLMEELRAEEELEAAQREVREPVPVPDPLVVEVVSPLADEVRRRAIQKPHPCLKFAYITNAKRWRRQACRRELSR